MMITTINRVKHLGNAVLDELVVPLTITIETVLMGMDFFSLFLLASTSYVVWS
jgi:hypothetical protein